jgi:hypothetical protein
MVSHMDSGPTGGGPKSAIVRRTAYCVYNTRTVGQVYTLRTTLVVPCP